MPRSRVSALAVVGLAAGCLLGLAAPAIAKESPARAKAEVTAPPAKPHQLPQWSEPPAYSVDMVMESEGETFVMKRYIRGGKIRSEISVDGANIVMIELGDEAGTRYTIMPEEKMAMKMTAKSLEGLMPAETKAESATAAPSSEPPADAEIEYLGEDTIEGVAAKKYRVKMDEGLVISWFDAANGAPLRMESEVKGEKSTIAWKNLKIAPQPDKLYEVPKGYEIQDMDEMMEQAKSMQGMPGGGLAGLAGGAAVGMAGGMATQAGTSLGAGLGSSLGAAFGGPLGAMAGQYIGGAVGGWVSKKVVNAVTPGK